MSYDYATLRNHLQIDMVALDKELMEMPTLIQDAAELAAKANEEERSAKHAYDVIKAEAASRLRSIEGKVPSEAQIDRSLPLEQDVQEARNMYEALQSESEQKNALVGSLQSKSRMLVKMSDLIVAGFLTPNAAYAERRRELQKR